MRSHIAKLILLCSILSVGSCKKTSKGMGNGFQGTDNSAVVGNWTWVGSGYPGSNAYFISPNSGVQKKLTFLANGTLYVTHNDTPATTAYLNVYDTLPLLPGLVVDTEQFQLGNEPDGCVSETYPAVRTTGKTVNVYQYTISEDTMQISYSPCLAPFTTFYIKN